MSGKTRGIFAMFLNNLKGRFAPPVEEGKCVGTDYMGNSYWEVKAPTESDPNKIKRWYFSQDPEDWDRALPPEWESWLRYRRGLPTDEEVAKNIEIARLKKFRGAEIEARAAVERLERGQQSTEVTAEVKQQKQEDDPLNKWDNFPKYPEYESLPGQSIGRRKKDPAYDE